MLKNPTAPTVLAHSSSFKIKRFSSCPWRDILNLIQTISEEVNSLGKGHVYQCAGCGFQQEYLTGVGFMAPQEAARERENILAGNYGPKAQAALQSRPEARVDVEHALYQCGACGKLESRLAVKLTGPVRVHILQRCDCGAIMHRIRAGEEMLCPNCGKPFEETDVVGVTFWD